MRQYSKERKHTFDDLSYADKLKEIFGLYYEHSAAVMKYRNIATFKELYDMYVEDQKICQTANDMLANFTDDELVLIMQLPIYRLEERYYAPLYNEYAYRQKRVVKIAKEVISTLENRKSLADTDNIMKYHREITRKLGIKNVAILYGITLYEAKALIEIVNGEYTITMVLDILTKLKDRIEQITNPVPFYTIPIYGCVIYLYDSMSVTENMIYAIVLKDGKYVNVLKYSTELVLDEVLTKVRKRVYTTLRG